MGIESRLNILEGLIAASSERPTVFDLLGIRVTFGEPSEAPRFAEARILPALQADPDLCECLRRIIGDDLAAEDLAAELVRLRPQAAAAVPEPAAVEVIDSAAAVARTIVFGAG